MLIDWDATYRVFRVTKKQILNCDHRPHVVAARVVLAHLLHSQGLTSKEIGRQLGKDHSTVGHYLNHMDGIIDVKAMLAKYQMYVDHAEKCPTCGRKWRFNDNKSKEVRTEVDSETARKVLQTGESCGRSVGGQVEA